MEETVRVMMQRRTIAALKADRRRAYDNASGWAARCAELETELEALRAGEPYARFVARVDGVYADGHDAWTVALDGTGGTARLCVADPPDMRATYRVTVERVED